ncbi:DNA translocase FtsK [Rubellimicrobium roseum]|uniref:DNA translocase FtsK n=1 Tax=Rubellimicrobium roseum TaxID=687525 RepID=A0A5C4NCL6_9RHOB|nr:DNA translocase FtsK [Rubellimicrobium roseum]TNC71812.1 hypothetical protein FHG71_10350 [Rubellimicrobium roseum]
MAYQTRDRAPLLDSDTQAALEKRGKELLGFTLLALGLLAAVMLGTYSPEDPNWLLASDAPTGNWLGRFGASVAHPLMMIVGRASWAIPLVLLAWGLRHAIHRSEERARAVFAPILVAALAAAFAALPPGEGWSQSYGAGGLFGDTALGFVLTVLPLGTILVSLLVWAGTLALGFYVLGVTRAEIRTARARTGLALVLAYAWALRNGGRALLVALDVYEHVHARTRAFLAERAAHAAERAREAAARPPRALPAPTEPGMPAVDPVPLRTTIRRAPDPSRSHVMPPPPFAKVPPAPEPQDDLDLLDDDAFWQDTAPALPPIPPAPSFLAASAPDHAPESGPRGAGFLSGLLRRTRPEPEPEPEAVAVHDLPEDPETDERIRARIGDAIRARKQPPPVTRPVEAFEPEPVEADPFEADPFEADAFDPLLPEPAQAPRRPAPAIEPAMPRRVEAPPAPASRAPEPRQPEPVEALALDDEDEPFDAEIPVDPAPMPEPPRPAPRAVAPAAPAAAPRPAPKPVAPRMPAVIDYVPPPLDLLTDPADVQRHHLPDAQLADNARSLEQVLDDFGVKGEIVSVRPGPVVTMYELEPAPGLKASRVIGLADDIARNMSALSARVSTVPGRNVIGIELPNDKREKVVLREILAARAFDDAQIRLPLALGKDIGGEPVVANLAKMPHLLIAGTTGSGKSVAINTMILSLLYRLTPEECRLIMIDPKMLELSVYDGIPHLLSPVVTDPKKAVVALKWVVGEMEERYRKMSKMGVRNIEGYNGRVRDALERGEMFSRTVQTGFDDETGDPIFETEEIQPEILPFIVVIVDEMADLMMVAGKEIEACIQRLAQMARASGIHLIMATQRPSVDVITGTIKANFPTRISFQVTSKIDSRTILGEQGAEQLLGQGDMLYMAGGGRITRIHGPFCSDEEVEEIVTYLKGFGPPDYVGAVLEEPPEETESPTATPTGNETEDALYDMAVQIVARDRKCSTSYIQRKLAIGYNKAARLVEQMEEQGVVTPANHVGKREILVPEPH